MDFKRPTTQPGEDIDARFEQRHEAPQPLQQPMSSPAPMTVKKSSKGYKFLTSLLIILLLAATGYGVYAFMDGQSLRNKLSDADTKASGLTDLNASLTKKLSDAKATEVTQKELTTKEKIELASSVHVCNIDKFGCDKVVYTVLKSQEPVASSTTPGFAVVEAKNATNVTTKLYLKSVDGVSWTVIYEGTTPPSQAVITRYAIPTGFSS